MAGLSWLGSLRTKRGETAGLSGFLAEPLAAARARSVLHVYEVGNDFQVARLKAVGVKPLLNMNSIHRAPEQAPAVRAGARRGHNYGSSKASGQTQSRALGATTNLCADRAPGWNRTQMALSLRPG
jgi:hypothetical protein